MKKTYKYEKNRPEKPLWVAPVILGVVGLALVSLVVWLLVTPGNTGPAQAPTEPSTILIPTEQPSQQSTEPPAITEPPASISRPATTQIQGFTPSDQLPMPLDAGLTISAVGKYTGTFVEGNKDTPCADVLAVLVENNTGKDLQYLQFTLTLDGVTRSFQLTTLPAGNSCLVMEQNEAAYAEGTYINGSNTVASYFQEPLSTQGFTISGPATILNIRNDGPAITKSFYVYYKNFVDGVYLGGITYRTEVRGGLSAGETRQLLVRHYDPEISKILFIQ